jgi:5-methylcytosine-specific restriction protein A
VIRQRILLRDPLCVDCLAATPRRVSASVEVDHRIPVEQGGSDDDRNLAGVCIPCHREKSARERRRQ